MNVIIYEECEIAAKIIYKLLSGSFIRDLKNLIDDKLGGWWVLDRNYDAKKQFNLTKFYVELIEMGYYPKSLFTVDVQPLRSNTTRKIITVKMNPNRYFE